MWAFVPIAEEHPIAVGILVLLVMPASFSYTLANAHWLSHPRLMLLGILLIFAVEALASPLTASYVFAGLSVVPTLFASGFHFADNNVVGDAGAFMMLLLIALAFGPAGFYKLALHQAAGTSFLHIGHAALFAAVTLWKMTCVWPDQGFARGRGLSRGFSEPWWCTWRWVGLVTALDAFFYVVGCSDALSDVLMLAAVLAAAGVSGVLAAELVPHGYPFGDVLPWSWGL